MLEREASADINALAAFMGTHCGALEVPPGWNEVPRAGGSYATYSLRTVIGCE